MKTEFIPGLVEPTELNPFVRINILNSLMDILKLNSVNSLYQHTADLSGMEFVSGVLDKLNINYHVDEKELSFIPKEGSFISISNHPYGGVDGLILIHLLKQIRPEIKVLANQLLNRIIPLQDLIIPVNPFERESLSAQDILQVRTIIGHLDQGHPLAMFPAGQVSTFNFKNRKVEDCKWNPAAVKMIRKLEIPVVPIYFGGGNSLYFYILSAINPRLRTAKLPSELFNKQNQTIQVRIGRPISPEDQQPFYAPEEYEKFLRTKTYVLQNGIVREKKAVQAVVKSNLERTIVPAQNRLLMKAEISQLSKESKLLSSTNFDVYLCHCNQIPLIINEIGRLREETFRHHGEGTNQHIDLDHHDFYYRHLFVWDRNANRIAGAYRMGMGDEIMKEYGVSGFYLQSLFKMRSLPNEVLKTTIELGRSFVVKEYQQKSICLHLLWKGLFKFIVEHSNYRQVIGPVSISNRYSRISKELIVNFLQDFHYDHERSDQVQPRKAFKWNKEDESLSLLKKQIQSNLQKLDKVIGEIEGDKGVPILLKKYLAQNASVLGFNIDPKFSNVLDCLMLLKIADIPEITIDQLGKEITNVAVFQRFYQEKYLAYNFIPQY